jgi:hypothetical protein
MVELHRVDGRTVTRAVGLDIDLPVVAMVAMDGGEVVAAWGLAWNEGRCFLWFHITRIEPAYRFIVIREARKMLKRAVQLGESQVFTVRDASFPTSARLLKILGFKPFGIEDGKEVHIWLS